MLNESTCVTTERHAKRLDMTTAECPDCGGSGGIEDHMDPEANGDGYARCGGCGGTGEVEVPAWERAQAAREARDERALAEWKDNRREVR